MAYEYTTQGYTVKDTGRRVVIDPVTRIEGHLRCEVNIDDHNVITNAVSCGTMFRGLEIIVKNRDPRDVWAFAERICGVCTARMRWPPFRPWRMLSASIFPDNANCIRNLMQLALWYHDHLVHFYQLGGLDWIDVLSAAKGDPVETSHLAQSLSPWPKSSPGYFAGVRDKLVRLAESGHLGIFKNGYWGHPDYRLSPEANLMLVAHYIEALDFQRDVVKIHTVFGGKNPHPNWLVGGVPLALNVDAKGGADVINLERLELVQRIITRSREFARQVLLPDAVALGKFYPQWFHIGRGPLRQRRTRLWSLSRHCQRLFEQKSAHAAGEPSLTAISTRSIPWTSRLRTKFAKKSAMRGMNTKTEPLPCIPTMAKPFPISCSAPEPRGPPRTSGSLMSARPIRGSRRRAGRDT